MILENVYEELTLYIMKASYKIICGTHVVRKL